jgi:phosphopantothenoylcysteine decarboxylase/phosphopantothenate--cysteine ligase
MDQYLKGKKILITAGPTWVAIDKVRAITNIFGGTLGAIIAENANKLGADVTLLFGPGRTSLPKAENNFKIIKFKYFEELLDLVKKEVGSKKYDIVIHSAAVADYTPVSVNDGKIKSGKESLTIELKPTIKIVNLIKDLDPNIFLVKFKLEVNLSEKELLDVAYKSMQESKADLIVANDFNTVQKDHKAFIIDKDKSIKEFFGKKEIALGLLETLKEKINHAG